MIRTIEELSMNAWPALQTTLYDGWVLRFARGYTRRSNSINPIYSSTLNPDQKIQQCEKIYHDQGLDVIFKMTSACQPVNLDEILAQRGYQADAHTGVHLLDLNDWQPALTTAQLSGEVSGAWLSAFCRMSRVDAVFQPVLEKMLASIFQQHCFASIQVDGNPAACGLGVVQDGWIGFYDIVTDARYRRCGLGRQIMHSLLSWGVQQGARRAYLQVMLNNAPALGLYAGLGFKEQYRYWYRVIP